MSLILAGDIGGTNSRLAFFDVKNGKFELISSKIFPSRDYSGFDEIVKEYVNTSGAHPTSACFGIPGPVTNGRVEVSNLPWIIEAKRLADELKIRKAILLNDLEAAGWGIGAVAPDRLVSLNQGGSIPGNQVLVSPGTGLGEGAIYWDGKRHHVFGSEGGHCDFAPLNDIQIEMLNYLCKRFDHVSYERVLSGPGLVNIFEFLRDTGKGKPPDWLVAEMVESDAARAISEAGMTGKCPMCEQALEIFVSIFGAEAGNCALKMKAVGGVFLGGGIAPKILPKLATSNFLQAFLEKGRLRRLMEIIPIKVVIDDKLGLLGAARCAFVETADETAA
jgi:glucokinase